MAQEETEEVAADSQAGDCEVDEEDSDSKAGEALNQALDGVSQAVQDAVQGGGEVEERAEKGQDL